MSKTDLAVLERWADPRALLAAGRARLLAVIGKTSHGQQGPARAEQWRAAAAAALELYGDHPAIAFTDLAAEVATEVRLLQRRPGRAGRPRRRPGGGLPIHRPGALAASLPGLAEVGAPDGDRDHRPRRAGSGPASSSARFTGLAPRASETGNTDRKGQPMSKAGNRLLRTTLIRAADNARRQDPQLARIYYVQMVERGAEHLKACCVVAAHLAERLHAVLRPWHALRRLRHRRHSGRPGHRQTDHRRTVDRPGRGPRPPTQPQADQLSVQAGKAPQQVLTGHDRSDTRRVDKRGDLPRDSQRARSSNAGQGEHLTAQRP